MKRMHHLLWAVICTSVSMEATSQDYAAIRRANEGAVVFIHSERTNKDGTGARTESFGTGFFVTQYGHAISANHVVLEESPSTTVTTTAWIGSRNSPQRYPVEVVKREPDLDLLLIALQTPSSFRSKPVRIGGSAVLGLDAALYALGFPGKSDLSPATGILSNRSGPKGRWQTTLGINRGNSGGPVFDPKTQQVVAIAWAGDDSAQQITYVIPETYATGLLQIAGGEVIAAKVRTKIKTDPNTKSANVVAQYSEKIVTLRGFALTEADKSRAEQVAKTVEGVSQVQNNIQVVKWGSKDFAMTEVVKKKLLLYDWKDEKIVVEAFDGNVFLTGFLKTDAEVKSAVDAVKLVPGVKKVSQDFQLYKF